MLHLLKIHDIGVLKGIYTMEPWSLVSTLGLAYMYVISTGECPSWRSASAGRPIWCRRARGMHMERDVAVEPWRCIYTDLRRRKKARAPCVPGTDASSYAGFMNPKHQTRPEQTRISLVLRRMPPGAYQTFSGGAVYAERTIKALLNHPIHFVRAIFRNTPL